MAAIRTIDITTTQNVTIEYELASLRERFLAFFIDGLVLGVIVMFLFVILSTIYGDSIYGEDYGNYARIVGLLPVTLFLMYQFLSEVLANGQSLGKKAIGIKVVRVDGKNPGLIDYLLRTVFQIVDTVFSMGIIGGLLISSTAKSQRLGDMTANTAVIRIKYRLHFLLEDILKIQTLDDYEPEYPDVKKFSEQDMLLIKTILTRFRNYPNEAHRTAVRDAVQKCGDILELEVLPTDKVAFLKTLIRDYIVLTR